MPRCSSVGSVYTRIVSSRAWPEQVGDDDEVGYAAHEPGGEGVAQDVVMPTSA